MISDFFFDMLFFRIVDYLSGLGWAYSLQSLPINDFLGEKKFSKDELVPVIIQLRKNKKDEGCYEDFVECLKLYDKNDNNKMVAGELGHMLKSLGKIFLLLYTYNILCFHGR